jgi:hypothetical protein
MSAGRSAEERQDDTANILHVPFISSHGTRVTLASLKADDQYRACVFLVMPINPCTACCDNHYTCRYWQKIVRDVKHEARSELSISKGDWSRRGEAGSNVLSTAALAKPPACDHTIPRVHIKDLTVEEFVRKFEAPKKPVIIQGLLDDWPARDKWLPEKLLQRIPDAELKVGADDDGYPVRMKLKHYLMYITDSEHGEKDDSPLYIFDGTFSEKKGSSGLSQVRSKLHSVAAYENRLKNQVAQCKTWG